MYTLILSENELLILIQKQDLLIRINQKPTGAEKKGYLNGSDDYLFISSPDDPP